MYLIFRSTPVTEPFTFDCIDRHWDQSDTYREHGLPFYHYLQTETGKGVVKVADKEFVLHENEGIIIAPFVKHSYHRLEEEWDTCFISFTGIIESSIPRIIGEFPYIFYSAEKGHLTAALIDTCIKNYSKHFPADMNQTSIDCYQILLHLASENQKENLNDDPLFSRYVRPVLKEIENNYSQSMTVDELSKTVFISPQYLSRLFQKFFNCSTNDYIIKFRISKAKELLISRPNVSIQDIAYLSGFNDVSHFIALFRKKTGYTPLEFRKNN